MTNARLRTSTGKATRIKKIGAPILLVISSTVIAVLLVELLCRFFLPLPTSAQGLYRGIHRVVFFDGPEAIFRNQGDMFTFVPHGEIRNVSGSILNGDYAVEYDYRFRTNNFGLVQDVDVVPARDSILLLGDSFTEGQGAEPWFRRIAPAIDKLGYQPINGGLLGTGFQQWLRLERYLSSRDIRIRKLAVVFISDDYHRTQLTFRPNDLRCLSDLALCRFEESLFYKLPSRNELSSWIDRIRTARAPMIRKFKREAAAESLLPASFHIYKYLSERLLHSPAIAHAERAGQQSHAAIAELVGLYGAGNIVFIHLPQKEELNDGPNSQGRRARSSIEQAGGRLYDGFKLCHLTRADYYADDEHPNSGGYLKISQCFMDAVNAMVLAAQ